MKEEILELPEICYCGNRLYLRSVPVEGKNKTVDGWIIYGFCEKCKIVNVFSYFDEKVSPTEGIDFKIIKDKVLNKKDLVKESILLSKINEKKK